MLLVLLATAGGPGAAQEAFVRAEAGTTAIAWRSSVGGVQLVLRVSGPDDFYFQQEFGAGEAAIFSLFDDAGEIRRTGSYSYEVRANPVLSDSERRALNQARETGSMAPVQALQEAGVLPSKARVLAGYFAVLDGSFEMGGKTESRNDKPAGPTLAPRVVLTNADGVIRNSLCVGFDCPDAPAFDDSTILLMENNTRIKFGDTSNAPFPNNDWEIEANSSLSGGANYLGFNDCGTADNDGGCATDLVFAVESGARQSALYVQSDGDVGLGTSTPVLDLHIVTGNSPALRLEQDGSSGFAAQTWDIAGNETNFFVRDVTAGSRLPLRILPGAPSSSVFVASNGNVALGGGSTTPTAPLHIKKATGVNTTLVSLENNGPITFSYVNTAVGGETWNLNALNGGFAISIGGSGINEFFITDTGNVEVPQGTVVHTSSRTMKHDIQPVDVQDVLAKVASLPLASWRYNRSAEDVHMGPMAEDFYAAFGLGSNPNSIALSDTAGVALVAIQGLNQALDQMVRALTRENAALAERLTALESLLAEEQTGDR